MKMINKMPNAEEITREENIKGHKQIADIYKDDLKQLGVKEVAFFKWYIENYCSPCSCEMPYIFDINHKSIPFYDLVACAEQLKNDDMKALKKAYEKVDEQASVYYYAKISYFGGAKGNEVIENEANAILYKSYAIIYLGISKKSETDKAKYLIYKNKKPVKKYDAIISSPYTRRPRTMSEADENAILMRYIKCPKEATSEEIGKLLKKFKEENKDKYSYVKVKYFFLPKKGQGIWREEPVIIHNTTAYLTTKSSKNLSGKTDVKLELYDQKPKEMSQKASDDIERLLKKKYPNSRLTKPKKIINEIEKYMKENCPNIKLIRTQK